MSNIIKQLKIPMSDFSSDSKLIQLPTLCGDNTFEGQLPDILPFIEIAKSMGNSGSCKKGKGVSWSLKQNSAYITFLEENEHLFRLPVGVRKRMGIHKLMEQQIKTRDSLQCRSHHQKMMARYKSLPRIIKQLEKQMLQTFTEVDREDSQKNEELIDYSNCHQEKYQSVWSSVLKEQTMDLAMISFNL